MHVGERAPRTTPGQVVAEPLGPLAGIAVVALPARRVERDEVPTAAVERVRPLSLLRDRGAAVPPGATTVPVVDVVPGAVQVVAPPVDRVGAGDEAAPRAVV